MASGKQGDARRDRGCEVSTTDPFAEIQRAAERHSLEEQAMRDVSLARTKMVLGKDAKSVFFATLALRLEAGVDWSIDTAATDGRRLLVNPEWFAKLPRDQQLGVVAHEVMHPAMGHHARRGSRTAKRWNIACDAAINPLLRDAGFVLPPEGVFPGVCPFNKLPVGLSAEEYYVRLPADEEDGRGSDPGGCGEVMEAAEDPAAQTQAIADWQVAVAQAHQAAKQRGTLPAGLQRLVDETLQPVVDWRNVLREFVRSQAKNDYSWSRPNRRFVHLGIYLPSLHSEQIGDIVIAVDTSGSIGSDMLNAFAAECEGILSAYDCSVSIVYCDCEVQHVQQWRSTDGPLVLEPRGGGGTSHVPVWQWLSEQADTPECVICLTDGMTDFGSDPGVPVLWCLTQDCSPPFGRKVVMQ